MRFHALPAAAALLAAGAATAHADEETLRRQIEDLTRRMQEMDDRHRREIEELKKQIAGGAPAAPAAHPPAEIPAATPTQPPGAAAAPGPTTSALQEQVDRLADAVDDLKAKRPASPGGPAAFRLIDLSLNALMTGGTSTGDEDTTQLLQAGGHDPRKRGFTVQNVELQFAGAVDPYFTANANIVTLLDPEGDTEVELEEAYATTSSLPHGFQVKAGQFLTAFGRQNATHPHGWDFIDVPVVNARILGGDGMRGPGVQASWLGTGVPLELTAAIQNANGETMASFLSPEPPVGTRVERDVRSFGDTALSGRAAWSFDATDEIPLLFGASCATGPSGSSSSGDSRVFGADFTAKWKPLTAEAGFPFVSFRTEWLGRRYEFDDAGGKDELDDSGWYAQTTWGFRRDWTLGLRFDTFDGDFDDEPGLDDRTRWSAALTWYTSEFAKLRLQVNQDHAKALDDDVTSVWLQIEFNLGQHGAHKF